MQSLFNRGLQEIQSEHNEIRSEIIDFNTPGEFKVPKVPKDSLIQIALQATSLEVLGRILPVNEAIQMRHFQNGRYDTLFCLTEQSLSLINEFRQTGRFSSEALRSWVNEHRNGIREVKEGRGPILHLVGLLICLQKSGEVHPLLKVLESSLDPWLNCEMTTSNVGWLPGLRVFGFTDAIPEVLGIAYFCGPGQLTFNIKADYGKLSILRTFKEHLTQKLEHFFKKEGVRSYLRRSH
jgi:carnitine O-acetyltransferase